MQFLNETMTEAFIQHIKATTGVALDTCARCKTRAVKHVCGQCYKQAYCGVECQTMDWHQGSHSYQCIAGRDNGEIVKREKDTEQEKSVNLLDFPPDLLRNVIPKYLNADDLRTLSSVSKELNRLARAKYFESRLWKITPQLLADKAFETFAVHVTKVQLSNDMTLDHLKVLEKKCPNITQLEFGRSFNQELQGALPHKLTHLTFGSRFDQDVRGELPEGLTHLTFGNNFDQNVQGSLPQGLTHLTFGFAFNRRIMGVLPLGLTHLTFGASFDQDVYGAIPQGLTDITFGYYYQEDVRGALPESVRHVTVYARYQYMEQLRAYAAQHSIKLHVIV
jgi:hypothetical protein